ncbi:MAG: energy transducer TonB [Nitrospirota bacterium]
MNKGLFYHCLIISLIIHLAVVLVVKLEKPKEEKRREPIAIDLLGPLKAGPKTVLPPKPKYKLPLQMPQKMARASAPRNMLQKAVPHRHFLPSFPVPERSKLASVAPARNIPAPAPAPVSTSAAPGAGQPAAGRTASPSAPSAGSEGRQQLIPRKLKLPTMKDLERYADVKKEIERTKDPNAITLDTNDFQYWSYLQGLKHRIEYIWKYPEAARRENIQGELQMRFTIEKSGKVTDVEILKSSGYAMLDDAAKKAVFDANPFNPLPDSWKKNSFTITGNFVYSLYSIKPFVE